MLYDRCPFTRTFVSSSINRRVFDGGSRKRLLAEFFQTLEKMEADTPGIAARIEDKLENRQARGTPEYRTLLMAVRSTIASDCHQAPKPSTQPIGDQDYPSSSADPMEIAATKDFSRRLRSEIENLPERLRGVVLLYADGYSLTEIGELQNRARQRIHDDFRKAVGRLKVGLEHLREVRSLDRQGRPAVTY